MGVCEGFSQNILIDFTIGNRQSGYFWPRAKAESMEKTFSPWRNVKQGGGLV